MSRRRNQPLERGKQLFENLFVGRNNNMTLEVLSEGLTAILSNANRLIEEVKLLVNLKRYASASFLLTTANEEMAKSYILLDVCRLDFSKHQSVLKSLCKAFYNHIDKYAYKEVVLRSDFQDFRDMNRVKEFWDAKITKSWPLGFESGVEMPHDTHFTRELPLYVDFLDYDQVWFVPEDNTQKYIFDDYTGSNALPNAIKLLDRLRMTSESGLYKAECLLVLNEIFREHYIKENTEKNKILRLYEKAAERIDSHLRIEREIFWRSALNGWPLYHFVS